MWSEVEIKAYLQEELKEDRFNHVVGVVETAEKMASFYGEDIEKARCAALLHDCAKNKNGDEIISILKACGEAITEEHEMNPDLAHGVAGAAIAKRDMGITNPDILNAVKYHTTGRRGMSLLEKIIYLADFIEPSRDFPGVDNIRKQAYINLNKALIKAFDNTISFVISKGAYLLLDTIAARNDILREIEGEKNER